MSFVEIQLVPQDGGTVSVTARNNGQSSSHVVSAEALQSAQKQVAALMAGFETGFRPLADPVTLSEVGRQLQQVFLARLDGVLSAADARRLLFTSHDPDCLNLPWELLPDADGRFLVADAASVIRRARQAPLSVSAQPLRPGPLEKFGKSLETRQAIGDRAGEAGAMAQIGFIALSVDRPTVAAKCTAVAFLLFQSIGSAEKEVVWKNLTVVASQLGLDQEAFDLLLDEAAE